MMTKYELKPEFVGLVPPVKNSVKLAISVEIEELYNSCPETTYMDAALFFIEQYDYDIDRFPKLINDTLKDKIQTEAIYARTLKGRGRSEASLGDWI